MGKLATLSGSEVRRILESQGFQEIRRRGSHCIMQKRAADTTVTVPVPLHTELRRGTLMSIVRQSGLPRGLFERQA